MTNKKNKLKVTDITNIAVGAVIIAILLGSTGGYIIGFLGTALATVLGWCVLPFVLPDIIKIALAVVITRRVRKSWPH